jgi:hypothetical protein
LTSVQENAALCQSCHNPADANAGNFAMNDADMAVPGVGGMHHAWAKLAKNDSLNTQLPTDSQMRLRVKCSTDPCPDETTRTNTGKIICSTCHNQHNGLQSSGGTPRIRPTKKVTDSGGGGTVTSSGTYTGSKGFWYWVEIVDTSSSDRFCWAKVDDIDKDPDPVAQKFDEWFPAGCDPPNSALSPNLAASGTVALIQDGDDGVQVTFGGSGFVVGERWEFSASWPFLRDELNTGADSGGNTFCINCHAAWNMTSASTWNGGSVKSHPIGVTIPGTAEDPFHSPPLDADGLAQGSSTDANETNDLQLFSNEVECLTCHGIHFVDSNTNTVDGPPAP